MTQRSDEQQQYEMDLIEQYEQRDSLFHTELYSSGRVRMVHQDREVFYHLKSGNVYHLGQLVGNGIYRAFRIIGVQYDIPRDAPPAGLTDAPPVEPNKEEQ